jgi:DNA-directed RNA polymerase specialized sigma subunit
MERLDELAARLRQEDDPGLRAELLRLATPLVEEVVGEFSDTGLPREELLKAGHLGLLAAVCNPHLDRFGDFSTFARNLIRGEIRARVRSKFPPPAPPRWLTILSNQLDRALRDLTKELGRPPTLEELGERLNLTPQGLKEAFKAREAILYTSLAEKRRAEDARPEFHPELIRDLRPSPFPWQARIRLAQALDHLASLWLKASQRVLETRKEEG